MILSNTEILSCLKNKDFIIQSPIYDDVDKLDVSEKPFNTSAIDLHLGDELLIPDKNNPVTLI